MKFRLLAAAAVLPLSMIATGAHAQDAAPASQPQAVEAADAEESTGPWEIDAEVGVHTDYRFRGISLSGKDPEVTGELSIGHESGFYGVAWVSNVDLDDGEADEAELDLSLGWSGDAGPINVDIGGVYYLYPGNSDFNYFELYASAGYAIGDGEIRAGVAFAPSQDNIGNTSNRYYYLSGEMPIKDSPVTLHASVGLEDGAFGDKKRDWLIGADLDLGKGFTATLDYVDTDRAFSSLGSPTFVGRLTFGF